MSKKEDDKAPTTFPEKFWKIIIGLPEFKDAADSASVEELKKIIVSSEGNISTVEKEKEADFKLSAAKDMVKDLSAGYRDALKCQVAKIKYSLFLLEGKGVDLENIKD